MLSIVSKFPHHGSHVFSLLSSSVKTCVWVDVQIYVDMSVNICADIYVCAQTDMCQKKMMKGGVVPAIWRRLNDEGWRGAGHNSVTTYRTLVMTA